MTEKILSLALGKYAKELESRLLFGSVHNGIQKINAFYEADVKRNHFWPIYDYNKQLDRKANAFN